MLAAWALLSTAISATFSLLTITFFPRLSLLECAFIAPPLGLSLSAWLVLALKTLPMAGHGISFIVLMAALIVQTAATALAWPRVRALFARHRQQVRDELTAHRVGLAVLSVLSVWWFYMAHIHYLFKKGSDHIAGGSVYADLPFHLNLSSSFLNGANEDAGIFSTLISSFYAGAPLAYPFIPDFYIAVLAAAGMDWHAALSSTGGILLSSLTALAYMLNFRLVGSRRAAILSLFLAVCTGGLGGFYYAAGEPGWWTPSSLTSQKFIHGPDHVLYWVGGRQAFWFGMCAHILFPQRTVQHAYPLALAAMLVLWKGVTASSDRPSPPAIVPAPSSGDSTGSKDDEARGGDGDEAASSAVKPRRRAAAPSTSTNRPAVLPPRFDGSDGKGPSAAMSYTESAAMFTPAAQMRVFALAGLITGLLPLMQPHSYISVGVIALVLAAGGMAERVIIATCFGGNCGSIGNAVMEWVAFGVVALGTGLPQFLKHFAHRIGAIGDRGAARGFLRYSPAWGEEGRGKGPWRTVWEASGIFVPLLVLSVLLLRRRAQAYFLVGLAVLFVIAHLVMFQPWHWDNTKVLCCWIFPASGFVGAVLDAILTATGVTGGGVPGANETTSATAVAAKPATGSASSKTRAQSAAAAARPLPLRAVGFVIAAALFVALTFSGALGTWREMLNNAKVYDDADFDFADWITKHTPPQSVFMHDFVTQQNHIRPESSLAGRQIAIGYAGWLSSHGLYGMDRRSALSGVMQGTRGGLRGLADVNISYITVDPGSRRSFSTSYLDTWADYAATSGKYSLWRVLDEVRDGAPLKPCGYSAKGGGGTPPTRDACILAGCYYFGNAAPPERCVKTPHRRVVEACGPSPGGHASKEACDDSECLWFEGFTGGPSCQRPRHQLVGGPAKIPTLHPGVPGSDCGWSSMSPSECEKRGCVWRQPTVDAAYAPWCVFT